MREAAAAGNVVRVRVGAAAGFDRSFRGTIVAGFVGAALWVRRPAQALAGSAGQSPHCTAWPVSLIDACITLRADGLVAPGSSSAVTRMSKSR
jgi:hypothetical protein